MNTSRRGFLSGIASLLAAPPIVRASSLMPVKAVAADTVEAFPLTRSMLLQYQREFIATFEENYPHRLMRVEFVRNPQFEVVRT